VVKNMAKLRSVKSNAGVILRLQEEFGSFADFLWRFVDFKPIVNAWESEALVPAKNALSERVSRELKKRGIKFAGPVIVYSFLQAAGIIDDHIRSCPRQKANRNDC
ncbi:MAG: DNA-3-methyladenine glycosylase I, partial [Acidaminococcaceae bacterium]|nr:DNA-3-methyladenine glycosylase I [Acidaminococcaceae bacterium]